MMEIDLKHAEKKAETLQETVFQQKKQLDNMDEKLALLVSKENELNKQVSVLNSELSEIKCHFSFKLIQRLWNNRLLVTIWNMVKKK